MKELIRPKDTSRLRPLWSVTIEWFAVNGNMMVDNYVMAAGDVAELAEQAKAIYGQNGDDGEVEYRITAIEKQGRYLLEPKP